MLGVRIIVFLMLLERLGKLLPKILYAAFYVLIVGILLFILERGFDDLFYYRMLYKPEAIYKFLYKYVMWWWPQKELLGFGHSIRLIIAVVAPHFIMKFTSAFFDRTLRAVNHKVADMVGNVHYRLAKKRGTTAQSKTKMHKKVQPQQKPKPKPKPK